MKMKALHTHEKKQPITLSVYIKFHEADRVEWLFTKPIMCPSYQFHYKKYSARPVKFVTCILWQF